MPDRFAGRRLEMKASCKLPNNNNTAFKPGFLTGSRGSIHTKRVLQLNVNKRGRNGNQRARRGRSLVELREGQEGTLERLDVPDDVARRLMELGFLPGSTVTAARSAPGGDPRVFRVDGSEVALRNETAAHIRLRRRRRLGQSHS